MFLNKDFKNFDIVLAMNNQTKGQDLLLMDTESRTYEVLDLDELKSVRFPGICRVSEKEFLIFGGLSGGNVLAATYKLDIETKALQRLSDIPRPISKSKCILFDRKVFVFGGKNSKSNNTAECSSYDLDTGKWLNLPDIPYDYNQILSVFGYEEIICLALNDSKFVAFDPAGSQWFFWRIMYYPFDKVCAFNNKLYLINDDFKAIYEYDIKNDLIQIATMINFDYDEFINFENSDSIVYLNHSLDKFYFYEVKFSNMGFTMYEKPVYDKFFSQYVLLLNNPNQYVFPKGNSAKDESGFFEVDNSAVINTKYLAKITAGPALKAEASYSHIFGGHATPFHLLVDIKNRSVKIQPIPTRLELKNQQGITRIDDDDSQLIFAGGNRQDKDSYGSIDVFRYDIKSNSVTRIQELNTKSKITCLTRVDHDIYLLNETKYFQRYDILKNKWLDMKPCIDDFFYNNFVYQNQLFTFISQKNAQEGYDFVVMCFNKEANDWITTAITNVDFIVTADFSYKVDDNRYLMIGHPLKDSDPNTLPYMFEMKIKDDPVTKFAVSVRQICKLTSSKVKSVRIVPLIYERKLLFSAVDLADSPISIIYDIEKQALGESQPLTDVYRGIQEYLNSIRFDFRLFENLNNVA